jgi:type VI secretion system protein ImpE
MTESPMQLYRAGKLDEAVEQSISLVKQDPTNTNLRYTLAELSCVAGDLERADRQLDTLSTQNPKAALRAALVRQLVRAEQSRRECFFQGRVPEFIGAPSERLQDRLRALADIRRGDLSEAAKIVQADQPYLLPAPFKVNGADVSEIRDLDDLLAPFVEIHTSTGKYFWIEWQQILSLELHAAEGPLDLLWRRATMSVEAGPEGEVYLPAVYLDPTGTHVADAQLRLGRGTTWVDMGEAIIRGQGQKTLLVGDIDLPLMQLASIERGE